MINFDFEPMIEYLEALDYPEERIEEYIGFLKLYNSNGYPPFFGDNYEHFEMACALTSTGFLKEYREFIKKRKRYLRIRERDLRGEREREKKWRKIRKLENKELKTNFETLAKLFTENEEIIKGHIIRTNVIITLFDGY